MSFIAIRQATKLAIQSEKYLISFQSLRWLSLTSSINPFDKSSITCFIKSRCARYNLEFVDIYFTYLQFISQSRSIFRNISNTSTGATTVSSRGISDSSTFIKKKMVNHLLTILFVIYMCIYIYSSTNIIFI